jgi:hypothetical protein
MYYPDLSKAAPGWPWFNRLSPWALRRVKFGIASNSSQVPAPGRLQAVPGLPVMVLTSRRIDIDA